MWTIWRWYRRHRIHIPRRRDGQLSDDLDAMARYIDERDGTQSDESTTSAARSTGSTRPCIQARQPEDPYPVVVHACREIPDPTATLLSLGAKISPNFDDYASGTIDAHGIICVLCGLAPCDCPDFASAEYFALLRRIHGKGGSAQAQRAADPPDAAYGTVVQAEIDPNEPPVFVYPDDGALDPGPVCRCRGPVHDSGCMGWGMPR